MKNLSSLTAAAVMSFCFLLTASAQGGVSSSVSGTIRTASGAVLPGVLVSLGSGVNQETTVSSGDGTYEFFDLIPGQDYTISPTQGPIVFHDYLSGISTFDLIGILRHILGIQLNNNPYSLIAFDINNSGSITILDLILLRRRILAIDTPGNSPLPWRFIPAGYTFPVPSNPWFEIFPESIVLENIAPGSHPQQDFIAASTGN